MSLKIYKFLRKTVVVSLLSAAFIYLCILASLYIFEKILVLKNERFSAAELKTILKCDSGQLRMQKLPRGRYWVLQNLIRGRISQNVGCADSITFTTHGDYTFFENLPTLVQRWWGPVSVAVYAPGSDMNATMDSIQYVRNCLSSSHLIRNYVTFHIYFHNEHIPQYVPLNEAEALSWPFDCGAARAPYSSVNRSRSYKRQMNLTYPINVGRNIARQAANTHFVFACDLELIPTGGLVPKFLQMISRHRRLVTEQESPRVFVLPIFELQHNASVPHSKGELVQMLRSGAAMPFHAEICDVCHKVPQQEEWLKAEDSEDLYIFSKCKRQGLYRHWEPFYISDNREPLFDERVTWEGQSNKRIQGYAMCLMDYEYFILHPAFLVHTPGIKQFDQHSARLGYVNAMNDFINGVIQPEYRKLYGHNRSDFCKV